MSPLRRLRQLVLPPQAGITTMLAGALAIGVVVAGGIASRPAPAGAQPAVQASSVSPANPVSPAGAAAADRADAARIRADAITVPPNPYESPSPYYLVSPGGAVWPLGGAPDFGSMVGTRLNAPVVGVTLTPDNGGYWLVAGDGGIFTFGDAKFYGSTGNLRLNRPVIGMASTPDGQGYWLFAGDGGIFTFGDAKFYGSTGNLRLNRPVIGMASTPDGQGYWLFAGDGGIFTFGNAKFYGSTGNLRLNSPIVSMTPTPDSGGYWMIGADGGVFTFGDAKFYGSLGGTPLGQSVARIVTAHDGAGYWEVAHDGDIHPFGSAVGANPPTIALLHTIEKPGDVAMEWALAQLGQPYAWGGTGPKSFDCSGLVMEAWLAAGVPIARVAADQYNSGTHSTMDSLLDGDLVFWASNTADPTTIYHVAMYIGGGHMVNAPHTGDVVRTDWIGGSGFVALATRP